MAYLSSMASNRAPAPSQVGPSSSAGSAAGAGWTKWQIALALGAPVVLGLGYWYFNSSRKGGKELGGSRPDGQSGTTTEGVNGGSEPGHHLRTKPKIVTTAASIDISGQQLAEGSLEDKADAAKIKGNQFFKEGKFEEAIKCYSESIALCPTDKIQNIATFYQNRAAAYEKLRNYTSVIHDCTMALDLNPKYTKALNRRAKAYEVQLDLEKALEDATAMCILEQFQNQSSLVLADNVLKQLGQLHAKEALKNRKLISPSKHFIKSYFSSFAEDPIFTFNTDNDENAIEKLNGFLKAHQDVLNGNYDRIVEDCSHELLNEQSPYSAEALVLRATFYVLRGQSEEAFADMDAVLALPNLSPKIKSNVLIKLASLKIQHDKVEEAFENFRTAEEVDPENADVFHHRGQVYLLLEKLEEAVADFDKATKLNPSFSIAAVQKCYADYRYAFNRHNGALLQQSMDTFRATVERFPHCSEGYTLYAQALVDQQEYTRADKYYDKALAQDACNANIFVHKGLLQLHLKQDFAEAISLMRTAIEKDDRCEFAYETLGALEVQRGNMDDALKLFDSALALARTEPEMAHLYSLKDAAQAQKKVAQRLGIPIPRVDAM